MTRTRTLPPSAEAAALLRGADKVVVIDDFHYIEREVQREILRATRQLVQDGFPLVLVSIPYRGQDAIRAEPELNGRVSLIEVELWRPTELWKIAIAGFEALNVSVSDDVLFDMVQQSSGSPHLMQEFCLQLCRANGLEETATERRELKMTDRQTFYFECASNAFGRVRLDQLMVGPVRGRKRKPRKLKNREESVDLYRAVILALAEIGPTTRVLYERDLRPALAEVLEVVPTKTSITNVCQNLYEIAQKEAGDPVLNWDPQDCVLTILDPFFSFVLRFTSGLVDEPQPFDDTFFS